MDKKIKIFLFLILILLISLFIFSVLEKGREEKNKGLENNVLLELPEGINLIDENKIEVKDDYSFLIDKENVKKIDFSNSILSVYEGDSFLPNYSFFVLDNQNNLSLDDWLEKYNKENGLLFFEQREIKNINNKEIIKIKIEGDPEHYNYYIDGNNSKIYIFSTISPNDFENVLNTFEILKK